ncbi:hypothetical protein STFE110948_02970 [Streptobacillus felis]|uniref:hypothetical protein n=1 Tax=Streptobacillus felis TaxID=1384509 RepID=UPI00083743A0|nr:hypothetical protein [Streptobacillus felis]
MIILLHQFSPYSINLEYTANDNIVVIAPVFQKIKYENYKKSLPKIIFLEDYTLVEILKVIFDLSKENNIEKVYTLNEDIIEWAALISEFFNNKESELVKSLLYTNKYYMRSFLNGIVNQPYFRLLKSVNDLDLFWENTKVDKAIIKPTVGMSSEKIFIINRGDDEIKNEFYKYNMKFLIEEYLEIDYMLTADGYSIGKDIILFSSHEYERPLLNVLKGNSKEYIVRTNPNYSKNIKLMEKLLLESKKVLECFINDKSVNGFHYEWFYDFDKDKFYLCEVAKRFGGASIPFLFNYAFNINLMENFWNSFIKDGEYDEKKIKKNSVINPQKIAGCYMRGLKDGKKIVKGLNIEDFKWTKNTWIFIKENQETINNNNISDVISLSEIVSETEEDFESQIKELNRLTEKIEYEK